MIIATGRPIPALMAQEETRPVRLLEVPEAQALVDRIAGRSAGQLSSWSGSIADAARRPLFAILLGTYLRANRAGDPKSLGELLFDLVDRALRGDGGREGAHLEKLARLTLDRGGSPVPGSEVALPGDLDVVIDSGLVSGTREVDLLPADPPGHGLVRGPEPRIGDTHGP